VTEKEIDEMLALLEQALRSAFASS
jgi:hypothetical protein